MKMTFCLQKQVPRFKLESGVRGTARMAEVRGQGSEGGTWWIMWVNYQLESQVVLLF